MKKKMLVAILLLLVLLCVCKANPIIVDTGRMKQHSNPTPISSQPDYPIMLLCLAGVIVVESVILFGFLRDFRIFWACPYANAASTTPGFFILGTSGLNASTPIDTLVCVIMICFMVSVLIEFGLIVAVVKKSTRINTFISIVFANIITYLLIIGFVPLNLLRLNM